MLRFETQQVGVDGHGSTEQTCSGTVLEHTHNHWNPAGRDKMRSSVIHEELGVEPLLLCVGKDASWSPPCGGVPSTSNWEETPRQTQVQVERLYLCTWTW